MTMLRKTRRVIYVAYVLVILAAFYLLYRLLPADVVQTLREAYLPGDQGGP